MRRLLQFIALAIPTLAGPAGMVRSVAGPALVACACGCGAASSAECGCQPALPDSNSAGPSQADAPLGPPCWAPPRAPGDPKAAPAEAPVALAASSSAETDRTAPAAEPKPWPASVDRLAEKPVCGLPPARFAQAQPPPDHRFPDRQAQLSIFRI